MWAANLQQVFHKNPIGKSYDCWVLFLRHGSDTKQEKVIKSKHQEIDTILAEQNVNYSEITTIKGKKQVYEKFIFQKGKHPLFFILNKHPLDYAKKDPFMVIEWGKWTDIESLRDDLMSLVNFFADKDFRKSIVEAKNSNLWRKIGNYLGKHGLSILSIGATIAAALI